ncbi:hypothetical protein ACM66B_002301 [Microbotryomycetes sp. NB124-2]
MVRARPRLSELVLVACSVAHIFVAPYTKVEESFTLHATRDFLEFGLDKTQWSNFDHIEFPGAVPRSFVPPALLAALSWPIVAAGSQLGLWTDGLRVQIAVRCVLAIVNSCAIIFFIRRVRRSFGPSVARTTIALTVTQFHLLFWLSRTLPNMLALPLVQIALGMLVFPSTKRIRNNKGTSVEIVGAFALMTFAAFVMRLELVALIGPFALDVLLRGDASVVELGATGLVVAGASQALSVAVDSIFWRRTIWPEGAAIMFNVVQGNASQWGKQPFHYYFTNSLPKIFNFGYPVACFSMLVDRRTRRLGFPSVAFIGLLSVLGHKEWRFFVYVVPALNVCIAASLRSIQVLFSKRAKRVILFTILVTNLTFSAMALLASVHNYPGGQAMTCLQSRLGPKRSQTTPIQVHIDSHASMTGASRFLHSFESRSPWFINPTSSSNNSHVLVEYSKKEGLKTFDQFDLLVTGSRDLVDRRDGWKVVEEFKEFDGIKVQLRWPVVQPRLRTSVWILENEVRR